VHRCLRDSPSPRPTTFSNIFLATLVSTILMMRASLDHDLAASLVKEVASVEGASDTSAILFSQVLEQALVLTCHALDHRDLVLDSAPVSAIHPLVE
jgi:hypothetical protein